MVDIAKSIIIDSISKHFSSLIIFRENIIAIPYFLQGSLDSDIQECFVFPSSSRPNQKDSFHSAIIRFKDFFLIRSGRKIMRDCQMIYAHKIFSKVAKSFLYL